MTLDSPVRLFVAAILLCAGGCGLEDRNLTLADAADEPATAIAESLSTLLAAEGIPVDIETIGDPAAAIEAIRRGDIDLAIIEEPDQSTPGIVTLVPLYPSVLHVVHKRPDARYGFANLIRGGKIYVGPVGGAAHRLFVKLSSDLNITPSEYRLLDKPWTEVPDVFFIFGDLLKHESVAQLADYKLYSFGKAGDVDGGSVADGIVLRHHHPRPFLLPEGVYPTLAEDAVLTLSIRSTLVAHHSLDEELAYEISRTLFKQSQENAAAYPLVTRELNEQLRPAELMLPLHEGTLRFLDRDRPGLIQRNVDVLALYLTLGLTVLSGSIAYYRHRTQVRNQLSANLERTAAG